MFCFVGLRFSKSFILSISVIIVFLSRVAMDASIFFVFISVSVATIISSIGNSFGEGQNLKPLARTRSFSGDSFCELKLITASVLYWIWAIFGRLDISLLNFALRVFILLKYSLSRILLSSSTVSLYEVL